MLLFTISYTFRFMYAFNLQGIPKELPETPRIEIVEGTPPSSITTEHDESEGATIEIELNQM